MNERLSISQEIIIFEETCDKYTKIIVNSYTKRARTLLFRLVFHCQHFI
jgi:hypothetical protein